MKVLVKNKKARFEYEILDTYEAGIALQGTEVKACRNGGISLNEAYAKIFNNELWLLGAHIAPYEQGNRHNHEPRRQRKLLVHKREIAQIAKAIEAKGLTLVPLCAGLVRGRIKIELGLGRGKNVRDKRQDIKKRLDSRETARATRRDLG